MPRRDGVSRREPRRSHRIRVFTSLALLVLVFFTSLVSSEQHHSRRTATSRSYSQLSSTSLSSIPALHEVSPTLDHRDPSSFLSQILIPRVPGSPGIEKVANLIKSVFEKDLAADATKGRSGWHTEEHVVRDKTPYGVKPFRNLIFTKNPKARRKLVISAHYDSKFFSHGEFVAATDSAAPCAMMIDLAYSLDKAMDSTRNGDDDLTLQLVFFDGEEAFKVWTHTDSTYGSRALAANWSSSYIQPRRLTTNAPIRKIDSIEHLVLLDLLGAKSPQVPSYFSSTDWLFQELISCEKRLKEAGSLYPPEVRSLSMQSFFRPGEVRYGGIEDDHLPFLANGVPILHIIPTPFPSVWHTLKDDASALDWNTDYAWAMILRLFTAEYLGLNLGQKDSKHSARIIDDDEEEEGWADDFWIRDELQ